MQTQKKNNPKTILHSRLEDLKTFVESRLKSPPPAPDQQLFAALRLWQLDHDYHFNVLRKDCVNVMLFIGRQMATINDEMQRRQQFAYMETMYGLYEFFDDAIENQVGINPKE